MRARVHGGFGEKGRTAIAIESGGFRLLLDCGVNTGDSARLYPAIAPQELASLDAMLITHAHEDHIAAMGWAIESGFSGEIWMTAETRAEADAIWEAYATQQERQAAARYPVRLLPMRGSVRLGPLHLTTGRSGHIPGGVWVLVEAKGRRALYCGDVVPESPVFAFDPLPKADLVMLDASYGADPVAASERHAAILSCLAEHPAVVLPLPLVGRSLDMLALIETPLALAPGMRASLVRQLQDHAWLIAGIGTRLSERLQQAQDWSPEEPWPDRPLLCHDAMGLAGPSAAILARAEREGHPVLFTGHVPAGSPGERMLTSGAARWRRYPTHPTLPENMALAAASGASQVLAHSCTAETLPDLAAAIPGLVTDIGPGRLIEIRGHDSGPSGP